jgi:DNA-binding transcriptional MerR regulator
MTGIVRSTAVEAGALTFAKPDIPNKLYFRIGDVSRLAGVKAHVLRYWESEFPSIAPKKSGTGHRLYRRKDVELVLEIKHLLYEKRFTIEGARKALDTRSKPAAKPSRKTAQPSLFPATGGDLLDIRRGLEEILHMLER